MMSAPRMSTFTSDKSRAKFQATYERLFAQLWPADHEPIDIPTRYGTTRAYRSGTGSGIPLVLLPGAGGNALMWHGYVTELGAAHPVVAVDPVGEPGASIQEHPIPTARDAALWLTDLLDGLRYARVHLLGCSYGGWVSLQHELHTATAADAVGVPTVAGETAAGAVEMLAAGAVGLPAAKGAVEGPAAKGAAAGAVEGPGAKGAAAVGGPGRVAGMTLIEPGGFGDVGARFVAWVIAGGLAGLGPRWLRRRAARWLTNATLLDDDVMALAVAGAGFRRRMPLAGEMPDADLRAIATPTLALFGARSPLHNAAQAAVRVEALMPAGRAEVIADTGHDLVFARPDRMLERVLNFAASTT